MALDIKLDPEGAKELVQQAMFSLLTEESRNALVQNALENLMKRPEKPSYHSPEQQTPLEAAFDRSLQVITNQVVAEYLEDEIVKEKIREHILGVLQKLINDKGTWLYSQIGYAVGEKIKDVLTEEKWS